MKSKASQENLNVDGAHIWFVDDVLGPVCVADAVRVSCVDDAIIWRNVIAAVNHAILFLMKESEDFYEAVFNS